MAVVEGTDTGAAQSARLLPASVALVVTQVVHALTPADTESEGSVGLIVGSLLLVASLAAVYGAKLRRPWAAQLTGVTGLVVSLGFVAYHSLPFHSPVTNPYFGEGVGLLPWLTVGAAIAAGLWCAHEAVNSRD